MKSPTAELTQPLPTSSPTQSPLAFHSASPFRAPGASLLLLSCCLGPSLTWPYRSHPLALWHMTVGTSQLSTSRPLLFPSGRGLAFTPSKKPMLISQHSLGIPPLCTTGMRPIYGPLCLNQGRILMGSPSKSGLVQGRPTKVCEITG